MAGQTQLSHKLGMDNGIFKHDRIAKVDRSSFPYGRKRDFCLDPGMIVPIDLWETLPGDYFEVKLDYLLKSFPLKVPPFTTYKVRTHWYYCKKVDLWKGALTYLVKGRSHSISLSAPTITIHDNVYNTKSATNNEHYFDTPMSLASYFGFQPGHYPSGTNNRFCDFYAVKSDGWSDVTGVHDFYGGVNLLPFFMYQKIYRFAYIKPNLLQNSKVWFPDDMSDGWRLHYDQSNLFSASQVSPDVYNGSVKAFFHPSALPQSFDWSLAGSTSDTCVNLLSLRCAMFEDDRFTTALPWSTRGTAPNIDVDSSVTINLGGQNIQIFDNTPDDQDYPSVKAYGYGTSDVMTIDNPLVKNSNNDLVIHLTQSQQASTSFSKLKIPMADVAGNLGVRGTVTGTASSLGFDINDLRAKIALTVWQERNATTSGYYNEMVYSHFRENPESQDYEPIYLGGTSDVISFSEVIQHDNSSNETTPQGHSAGLGENRSSAKVFSFRSKDYGYIMGVMIIQPETVYNSRIEKLWTRLIQEDEYFPEFQGLGLQEILKGEIYPTGTSTDKNLFGYNERDTEYKTRDNQAIGFFALPHSVDSLMSAYSQCREFSSQPSLSQSFVTMSPSNMRKDCLAVPSMPFFRCSLVTTVHAVRPMSYRTSPNDFGF